MRRTLILLAVALSALGLDARAHAAATTNLAPWEVISNAWHGVATNEVMRRASEGDGSAQCYLGRAYQGAVQGFPTNFPSGREWLIKSAENNFAQAQNSLGFNAANGIGIATNYAEAFKWYQRAAEQGFARAEVNLARMYLRGHGVTADVGEAEKWYRRAAARGLTVGKSDLGFLLMDTETFGPTEKAEGIRWIREAANEGDARAQNRLGWILWKGLGVETDVTAAREWFLRSAEQGFSIAMGNLLQSAGENDRAAATNLFNLALKHAERGNAGAQEFVAGLYSAGLGVAQDRAKQFMWLEKAAAQDYAPALVSLGHWYHNSGPNEDRKKAFRYYERAAAMGSKPARASVADLLLNGQGGVVDEKRGLALLHEVAEWGDVNAQYDLATRYREGRGFETNVQQAIHWYSRLIERPGEWAGTVQNWAAMILGIMYATGDGVPRDDAKAFHCFQAGAWWNGADAQDSVGYCYATGRGVPRDDQAAVEWFEIAARVDDTNDQSVFYPAVANLGVMHATGRGGLKQDMGKAVAHFERAARHPMIFSCNVPPAQTALAICLYEGSGIKRDVGRAFKLFQTAADHGNPQAQLHLGVLYWRGEGTDQNATNAFVYLDAAARNNEPGASTWRDRVAKELTEGERAGAWARARAIAKEQPNCTGSSGHRAWNTGLRIPNLAITKFAE